MASLADLLLNDEDVDDLKIEDEELLRQIEEVNALRTKVNPESAAASCLPSPSAKSSAPTQAAAGYTKSKASLADKILADTDGMDVDKEFEAMEQELQQQLDKYKEQCEVSPAKAASVASKSTPAPSAPQDASATICSNSSWTFRPSSKSSTHPKEQAAEATQEVTPADHVIVEDHAANIEATPELLELRGAAAKMEDAFPDVSSDAPQAPERHRYRRARDRMADSKEDIPEDQETADMKQMLASLALRMAAIQQKHSLHDVLEHETNTGLSNAAQKAIADLKAQNAHLRARFQATGKKGLLHLDPAAFGSGEKSSTKTSAPSPSGEAQKPVTVDSTTEEL